ncbi:MAG: methyltransferase domain-containing protein [Clostridia bacterium]|nr:methyltransferase domain-containing protein [Clostridia bacterium]
MVQARSRFLDAGYYEPFAKAVVRTLESFAPGVIIDAGCGEGYYSTMVSREINDVCVLGFDLSKSAINKAAKRAGKNNPSARFFVCGIFELPLADESADAVINLFAPCADSEFFRVIKPGGHLIMGVAGEDHLIGLKSALYDDVYLNRPEKVSAPDGFFELSREKIKYNVTIKGKETISDLFSMTPYYWKTSEKDAAKLNELESLDTVLDFDIIVFERIKNSDESIRNNTGIQ